MTDIKIAFLNISSVINDAEAQKVMSALNKQVKNDFAPVWGIPAELEYFTDYRQIPSGYWWLIVADNSDQAGALGYHDLTAEGMPLGFVFAKTDLEYNSSWSVTASHELLEMLEDPDINLTVFRLNESDEALINAYEICDACEADELGYKIDGVLVSDFVYPAWFEDFTHPQGTIYDFMKQVSSPFQLLDGGYIGINKLDSASGWMQLYLEKGKITYKMRPAPGARRERRRTARNQWLRSAPKGKKRGSAAGAQSQG